MDQERIGLLLAKQLTGVLTPEEQEELEWAFLSNPRLREILHHLQGLREQPPKGVSSGEEARMLERGIQWLKKLAGGSGYHGRHSEKLKVAGGITMEEGRNDESVKGRIGVMDKERNNGLIMERNDESDKGKRREGDRRWIAARWLAAAVLLLVVLTGAFYIFNPKKGVPLAAAPLSTKEIVTKYGARSYQELPDGSRLWLNAGSKVYYADRFSGGQRELTLRGEAYFDIKHDAAHPFIIHAGSLNIRVLGTSLNVKAYPGDSTMETTLIKGKVEIDFAGGARPAIVLQPNEKVTVALAVAPKAGARWMADSSVAVKRSPVVPDKKDGIPDETSWVEDKLVFRNESLSSLALQLERWYDVKIVFENDHYLNEQVTGAFKDAHIDEVMHALQITSGFNYDIRKDTVWIW